MLRTYTVNEWAEVNGMEVEEVTECYGEAVEFYGDIEGEMEAACKRPDGTYTIFGYRGDMDVATYEEVKKYLAIEN